jgi:hypothetical protein
MLRQTKQLPIGKFKPTDSVNLILEKRLLPCLLLIVIFLSACGSSVLNSQPISTLAPLTLPPTWTPNPIATVIPTFTELATFTPVPAFTPLTYPTTDSFRALIERFQPLVASPNGEWTVYVEAGKTRIVNADATRTWTLPCELFDRCSAVFPVKWSRNSQFLYFAPVPSDAEAPAGISLLSALAMIDMRSGKWELLLPDSDHYYDFTFSQDDDYIAYTQSSGELPGNPTVTFGIFRIKNRKVDQQFTLDGMYAGNIVWSPFKSRLVFHIQDPSTGSSVVFYDMVTNVLKYVLRDEQSDLILSVWDENNSVSIEKKDWATHLTSYWLLNPFTGELSSAFITATSTN